ncbi:MAG: RNA polymerase sigma factor [Planctomycetaceae bacterium]|nr:RNA polymerase sigma factor [Planctomycetaceae bacterium]
MQTTTELNRRNSVRDGTAGRAIPFFSPWQRNSGRIGETDCRVLRYATASSEWCRLRQPGIDADFSDPRDRVVATTGRRSLMELTLLEDHELLHQVRRREPGFQDAVAVLMERLGGMVVSFIGGCASLQPDDLDDVVQQVWIRVFRPDGSETFASAAEFRGWLKSVARSRTVDFLRRRRHSSLPEDIDPSEPVYREDPRLESLQLCMEELESSKPQFAAVVRAVTAGRDGREISYELGISRGTVYTRFDRAKAELKECMERRQQ